ncbi:MAG: hypothetical protein ACI841_003343, partial [Planctomycetota bacterium]
ARLQFDVTLREDTTANDYIVRVLQQDQHPSSYHYPYIFGVLHTGPPYWCRLNDSKQRTRGRQKTLLLATDGLSSATHNPTGPDAADRRRFHAHASLERPYRVSWIEPGDWQLTISSAFLPAHTHALTIVGGSVHSFVPPGYQGPICIGGAGSFRLRKRLNSGVSCSFSSTLDLTQNSRAQNDSQRADMDVPGILPRLEPVLYIEPDRCSERDISVDRTPSYV